MKFEDLFTIIDHAPDVQMDALNLVTYFLTADGLDIVNCCCCCCCI